jgi:hypothetical protein
MPFISGRLSTNTFKVGNISWALPPEAVDYTSTSLVIPEPSIPTINAGQSFSTFGNTVFRITDANTNAGKSYEHYYSDRSPLNANSTWLWTIDEPGGQPVFFPINSSTGAPNGSPVFSAISCNLACWHPTDSTAWYFPTGTNLKKYNPATQIQTQIRSFATELAAVIAGGDTGLRLDAISMDGRYYWMAYEQSFETVKALLRWDSVTDGVNLTIVGSPPFTGLSPQPNNTFKVEAFTGCSKNGSYGLVALGGAPTNPPGVGSLESQLAFSHWRCGTSNFLSAQTPLGNWPRIGHNAILTTQFSTMLDTLSWDGYLPNGNPNWLTNLRLADLTGSQNAGDENQMPHVDAFANPQYKNLMTGRHLTCNGTSDKWVVLSLYQEVAGARASGYPFQHEFVAVNTNYQINYDNTNKVLISNGVVRRLGHHFSYPEWGGNNTYWSQPRGALSLDQKFLVYTSSLGQSGRHDVFILKLPSGMYP